MTDRALRSLNLRATTFEPIDLTAGEFIALFRHPLTLRYLAIVFAILLVADPGSFLDLIPTQVYLGIWALAFLLYLGFQAVLIVAIGCLRALMPQPPLYWPLVSLLTFFPTLGTLELLPFVSRSDLAWVFAFDRLSYVLVTIVLFETLYLRFILPRVMDPPPRSGAPQGHGEDAPGPAPPAAQDIAPEGDGPALSAPSTPPSPSPDTESDAAGPRSRQVHISGTPVPLLQLQKIEAQEHHVVIQTCDGRMTLRARLSDIVAQTHPSDGIQPHRSWWVARRMVDGLSHRDGKAVLLLKDQSCVPVARGRLADVRSWVDEHIA